VELYEASRYGVVEKIPTLLTTVSANTADSVSMRTKIKFVVVI